MWRLAAVLMLASCCWGAEPADWVPVRWPWTDARTLGLLNGTPVNCLLLEWKAAAATDIGAFALEAKARGIATLAVVRTGGDAVAAAKTGLSGIVLEGDFTAHLPPNVPVVSLTSRARMDLAGSAAVIGTDQGVWPGVRVGEQAHAGPTGGTWIDTNAGFFHAQQYGHERQVDGLVHLRQRGCAPHLIRR